MRLPRIERVKGMEDVLPPSASVQRIVEQTLMAWFNQFGYQPVSVPVVEHTELFLRKSGDEVVNRLYAFVYQNRRLCLRPELTASVVRAYVDNLQDHPLPLRLCYSGPVFRYESPQAGRTRQFTQVGVELIGAAGPAADAEVIALALGGLERLGLREYRVVIGHIGILLDLLTSLHLDQRLIAVLMGSMETLVRDGRAPVEQRLHELYPEWYNPEDMPSSALAAIIRGLDPPTARQAIRDLLTSLNMELEGMRNPDEIVDRLLGKLTMTDRRADVDRVLTFMEELGHIRSDPAQAIPAAQALLERHRLPTTPLAYLNAVIQHLDAYGLRHEAMTVDFGLSRGLAYYTGMVFEVYYPTPSGQRQLCGGGRYDDLIAVLGGREAPACGFSYGLERVTEALSHPPAGAHAPPVRVLVVPVAPSNYSYAVRVAMAFRQAGIPCELDVRGRGVKGNLQYAQRSTIPLVAIVGEAEENDRTVVVRVMAEHREDRTPLDRVVDFVRAYT